VFVFFFLELKNFTIISHDYRRKTSITNRAMLTIPWKGPVTVFPIKMEIHGVTPSHLYRGWWTGNTCRTGR